MTQEDKELLLKDFCGRLPYGVMVLVDIDKEFDGGCISKLATITEIKGEKMFLTKNSLTPVTIEEIRPYLRSKSSITEEETDEFLKTMIWSQDVKGLVPNVRIPTLDSFDWLNKNHFDYRNLLERDLAIAVTEENNPYKN